MNEYTYNLYVADINDIYGIDKTLVRHHTIITFGIVDSTITNELKKTYKHFHYINYPFPNSNLTVRETVTQLYYKTHEIFKQIEQGLLKGDVVIACYEPNQLSSLMEPKTFSWRAKAFSISSDH